MNKSQLLATLIAAALLISLSPSAKAAVFPIAFYEQTGDINDNGHNFFDDYTFVGGGVFEIANSAVNPNNRVMFGDPEFLSFVVSFIGLSTGDISTFTLGVDDFEEGDTNERGLLFDSSATPLRFDQPTTTASSSRTMCDPICEIAIGSKASVSLIDNDSFEGMYLNDGTVTTVSNNVSGDPFTAFAGNWTYQKGTSIGGAGTQVGGFYVLSPVPVPPAIWLFATALVTLVGAAKRNDII